MRPAPQLRPMIAADLSAARPPWAETEGVELAEGDSAEELILYLRRNLAMSFVAVGGEQLVGAVLAGHDGRRGLLYHLAVDREHRGVGWRRASAARSIAALKEAGIVRVLILVSRDNPSGEKFWSAQGWEPLTSAQLRGFDL